MKKKLMLSFIAVVAAAGSLMAQTAQELSTPAGKTKAAVTTLAMKLNLSEEQRVKALNIFTEYYNTAVPGTSVNNVNVAVTKRDLKLKGVLTQDQYRAFRKDIESTLQN